MEGVIFLNRLVYQDDDPHSRNQSLKDKSRISVQKEKEKITVIYI